jgi:hypothetical protein
MKRVFVGLLLFVSLNHAFSQSICIDSIFIDGSITRIMKYKELVNTGIKIDSITSAKPMDSYDADSMIYIGSSVFWYYTKRGICEAKSICFDRISNIQVGRFKINKSTSHQDLGQMFPLDCKNTRPISINRQDGFYQICSIPVKDKKGQLWDMEIIFYLKEDRLVRVDIWEPM